MYGFEELVEKLNTDSVSYNNATVLITGGAGFLGSWLTDTLLHLNANIINVDNYSSGVERNISNYFVNKNFKFIRHDISYPLDIKEDIDFIFHMASRASPFEFSKFPIEILRANTIGTMNVLEIAAEKNAKLVYTSTSEAYGDPDPKFIPTPETYFGNVNPNGPRSCYDESKRTGEAFVKAYILEKNLDARIIRIFNTYGPRMRSGDLYGRVIPNFLDQALNNKPITVFGDGSQTRSFTYVTDEIEGILKTGFESKAYDQVINIGNNKENTVLELAKIILEITNSNSEIKFFPLPKDDPKRRCPDIALAKKLLNWTPTTPLKVGLKRQIDFLSSKR